ncbi:MAG: hypothetical protein K0R54_566 [Clostridiaceae bacterium]|jgi:predicted nucleic-acid-binding Zn-ribbon protein|nr:hypothetical protein [Clostridiaceae bacterium]
MTIKDIREKVTTEMIEFCNNNFFIITCNECRYFENCKTFTCSDNNINTLILPMEFKT